MAWTTYILFNVGGYLQRIFSHSVYFTTCFYWHRIKFCNLIVKKTKSINLKAIRKFLVSLWPQINSRVSTTILQGICSVPTAGRRIKEKTIVITLSAAYSDAYLRRHIFQKSVPIQKHFTSLQTYNPFSANNNYFKVLQHTQQIDPYLRKVQKFGGERVAACERVVSMLCAYTSSRIWHGCCFLNLKQKPGIWHFYRKYIDEPFELEEWGLYLLMQYFT